MGEYPVITEEVQHKQKTENDVMQPFHKQELKASRGHLPYGLCPPLFYKRLTSISIRGSVSDSDSNPVLFAEPDTHSCVACNHRS